MGGKCYGSICGVYRVKRYHGIRLSTGWYRIIKPIIKGTFNSAHLDGTENMNIELNRSSLIQLRKLLIRYFDMPEFQILCFDLGVDHEELLGLNKPTKMQDLISYLQRRNELHLLIGEVKKQRPSVNWPDIKSLEHENSIEEILFTIFLERKGIFNSLEGIMSIIYERARSGGEYKKWGNIDKDSVRKTLESMIESNKVDVQISKGKFYKAGTVAYGFKKKRIFGTN
jgi:hypothetical protein